MPLTSTGYTPRSLSEIRSSISGKFKLVFGSAIDTDPSSRFGQCIDIFSAELYSAELSLQEIYNAFFPNSSSNASLDNVVSITNTFRKSGTASQGSVFFAGDANVIVPALFEVQKTGSSTIFFTNAEVEIIEEANIIIAGNLATVGQLRLSWDGNTTNLINWNDDEATIKAAIEAHPDISSVNIIGTLNTLGSFHIEFITDTLLSHEPTIALNTLERNSVALDADAYFSTIEPITVIASGLGEVTVPSLSIQTLVTTQLGVDAVINYATGLTGTNRETDAELRNRRSEELQKKGTATTAGIKEAIEQDVALVVSVTIIENDTDEVDADGRPPNSIEIFVAGGDDDEVAQTIYNSKGAGIGVVSTVSVPNQRTGNYVDVNGEAKTLTFSQPVDVPMLIEVDVTVDANYPSNGEDLIKTALTNYFETLELGNDVLNHLLYTPINTVDGILTLVVRQDTVAGGSPIVQNTTIAATEVATLIIANITVTEV